MPRNLPNTFGGAPQGFVQEIIASDKFKLVPGGIMVAASARDSGSSPTTYLQKGLFLVKLTATAEAGQYKEYVQGGSNGQGDSSTGVVLQHDVDVSSAEPQVAAAYWEMDVYSVYLRGYPTLAADLAKINQRIHVLPYVRQ